MKFALNNNNFDSVMGKVASTAKSLELTRYEEEFTLYSHEGDIITEVACFTKEDLHTLWVMLSER